MTAASPLASPSRPARPRRAVAAVAATPADAERAAAQVMQVLPRAMDAMRQAMRAQIDGPLTVPQFRGLNHVDRHPGCSVSDLAHLLGVTLATASALVDRLVRAGHLQAQGSAADRRRIALQICPSGKAVLERMRQRTRAGLARALQGRTPQELHALVAGLQVLDAAFAQVEAETP